MLNTRSVRPDTRMDSVEDALTALREGRMVVVVDDESRENEGDLILPAATARPSSWPSRSDTRPASSAHP